MDDRFDLDRFVTAQAELYARALGELRAGRKTSHWMWFIFPQIAGLGHSPIARHYAIRSIDEARAYLAHALLGPRLHESVAALLDLPAGLGAVRILGEIDATKLRSSLTLFAAAAADPRPFTAGLDRFFGGLADGATRRLIAIGNDQAG